MAAEGFKGLTLEQLIRLRDHGVSAEYVRQLKTLGYNNQTPDDLVRLREAGITAERPRANLLDRKIAQTRYHFRQLIAFLLD